MSATQQINPPLDEKEPLKQEKHFEEEREEAAESSSSSSSDEEEDEEINQDAIDYADVTIPFSSIYSHEECRSEYFLSCVPVRVDIVERIHQPASHRLNPYLYVISITHGRFKWIIKRRYSHFGELSAYLKIDLAKVVVQHPTLAGRLEKVPKFPRKLEWMLTSDASKDKHMRKLKKFLQKVVNCDRYRNNKHTLDFLEVSFLSFVDDLGEKEKESKIEKRSGGYTFSKGIFGAMKIHIAWHSRWLVVKSSFVAYMDKDKDLIRDVLLLDNWFKPSCDKAVTGLKNGLLISNNSRNLLVKCYSARQAREMLRILVNMMSKKGCDWIREHRHDSFAPVRRNSWVKWYIDGAGYFAEVANAISMATEEIYITDWWLSPELLLQRPAIHSNNSRLDLLLKKRADNGVKIYVLLYKELEMTLSINSTYSKKTLMNLNSKNIMVMRHPDHVVGNTTLLWAHHEKIVCIDQKICFLGGLDLCYGRWDDHTHTLTDFGSATPTFERKTDSAIMNLGGLMVAHEAIDSAYHREQLSKLPQGIAKMFIGKDYCNPYLLDVVDVDKPFTDSIDRNSTPRMPWHDIGCLVLGNAARDVARHFIQRWNYTKHQKAKELVAIPFLLPKVSVIEEKVPEEFENLSQCEVQLLRSSPSWSTGQRTAECSIYEAYKEHIRNSKYYVYIENQFFITHLKEHSVLNEIGDVIVKRILVAFNNNETFRVFVVMPLLPSFPGEIGTATATSTCFIEFWNLKSCRNIISQLIEGGIEDPSDFISFCGLRNYAEMRRNVVTEIVYVHSKLMIVDDSVVIIGSANINDRSMFGSRDSELAVCVQDTNFIHGVMNEKQVQVGQFAARIRRKLFQEHLGLLHEPYANVIDPISDQFYKHAWMATANSNTEIYEKVFKCLPTNEVKSYLELEKYKKDDPALYVTDPIQARVQLKGVRGFLVKKPLDFLINQDLWPPGDSKEFLVPTKVFT